MSGDKGTYSIVSDTKEQLVARHNIFLLQYGLGIDPKCQNIPHMVANAKLHKPIPDTRFISSSATSSMKTHSLWMNRLFNSLLLDLDLAFGRVYKSVGIDAEWIARSWILKNTAAVIPLLRVWNALYADNSTEPPILQTKDFARLYTNIDIPDMKSKIMNLICIVFELEVLVGIKVREKKHAQWKTQVPANDWERSGKDEGGAFVIFDLPRIEQWLDFLLSNMYVEFGGQIRGGRILELQWGQTAVQILLTSTSHAMSYVSCENLPRSPKTAPSLIGSEFWLTTS